MMACLENEITAYELMQRDLESQHMGKWALVHGCVLVGVHDSFERVAEDAVRRFGRGPYLIRQIGAPPFVMPASVMYAPAHGKH